MFTDKTGNESRNHATISISCAIKKIGIEDFRVHDLRNALVRILVRYGVLLQESALVLGYRSLSTTVC